MGDDDREQFDTRRRAPPPRPVGRRVRGQSNASVASRLDGRSMRVSLSLGSSDALFPESPTNYARNARLQALGYLYTPLEAPPEPVAPPPQPPPPAPHGRHHAAAAAAPPPPPPPGPDVPDGPAAWADFQRVEGSDLTAKLDARVVTVAADGSETPGLPPPRGFGRIRVPGGYCVRPADTATVLFGEGPVGNPSYAHRSESAVLEGNRYLRMIPIVLTVEIRGDNGWVAAPPGKTVHVRLLPPSAEPAPPTARAVRSTAWANTHGSSQIRTIRDLQHEGDGARSPADYIAHVRARYGTLPATHPRARHAPQLLGGRTAEPWAYAVAPAPSVEGQPAPEPPRPFWRRPLPLTVARPGPDDTVDVDTDDEGKALAILLVSTCGGDAYRVGAWLTQPPNAEPYYVGETGTMVVWRKIRVARYVRWSYPTTASAEEAVCGGTLSPFRTAEMVDELAKAHVELSVPAAPERLEATELRAATDAAKQTLVENLRLIEYALDPTNPQAPLWSDALRDTLLPNDTDNPTAGLVRFAPLSTCRTALLAAMPSAYVTRMQNASAAEAASTHVPVASVLARNQNAWLMQFLRNLQDVMQFGICKHLLRDAPSGLVLVQAPASSSLESRSAVEGSTAPPAPDDLPAAHPFRHSGFATPYRGAVIVFGDRWYMGRHGNTSLPQNAHTPTMNALHELGHVLQLRHQYVRDNDERRNAPYLDEHDSHDLCMMGYRTPDSATDKIDFCGRCLLQLAGWDTGPIPPNGVGQPIFDTRPWARDL